MFDRLKKQLKLFNLIILPLFLIIFLLFPKSSLFAQTDTGGIDLNTNTGGTTIIKTGDVTNTVNIQNNVNTNTLDLGCQCTPTPEPPTPTQVVPTATPGQSTSSGGSSGSSNSSSGSSGSTSTSSPSQAVLGSQLAATGTFTDNLMNSFLFLGIGLIGLGFVSNIKKKNFILQLELQY